MDSLKSAAPSISLAPFKLFVLFTSKDDIRDAKWPLFSVFLRSQGHAAVSLHAAGAQPNLLFPAQGHLSWFRCPLQCPLCS